MNIKTLKKAEAHFLSLYPGGFEHPEMLKIGKKHKMDKLEAQAKEFFYKDAFANPGRIVEDAAKLISRSTMVSLFEKPKFKDAVKSFDQALQMEFANALFDMLHGKQKAGFEAMVELLMENKLAKWSLVSIIPAYYRPNKEIFVKPTTTKLIIDKLGVDLVYKPRPSWAFYSAYRKAILAMKKEVDTSLSPNNPAFCGFLMTSLPEV